MNARLAAWFATWCATRLTTCCAALALALLTLAANPARAQNANCTAGPMFGGMNLGVNFGLYNGTQNDAMSPDTLQIQCSAGPGGARVYICVGLGAGSGGNSVADRRMKNGTASIQYQLYSDPQRNNVFQEITGIPSPGQVYITTLLPMSSMQYDTGIRLYGRIPAGQSGLAAGTYTSLFSSGHITIRWARSPTNVMLFAPCGNDTMPMTYGGSFSVQAQVQPSCQVAVKTHVDFGSLPAQNGTVDAKGVVRVTCTGQANYKIELNDGLYPQGATGAPNARRRMKHASQNRYIQYELYRNAPMNQRWGRIANNQHLDGSGIATEHTVYARATLAANAVVGSYADTVVVTLEY